MEPERTRNRKLQLVIGDALVICYVASLVLMIFLGDRITLLHYGEPLVILALVFQWLSWVTWIGFLWLQLSSKDYVWLLLCFFGKFFFAVDVIFIPAWYLLRYRKVLKGENKIENLAMTSLATKTEEMVVPDEASARFRRLPFLLLPFYLPFMVIGGLELIIFWLGIIPLLLYIFIVEKMMSDRWSSKSTALFAAVVPALYLLMLRLNFPIATDSSQSEYLFGISGLAEFFAPFSPGRWFLNLTVGVSFYVFFGSIVLLLGLIATKGSLKKWQGIALISFPLILLAIQLLLNVLQTSVDTPVRTIDSVQTGQFVASSASLSSMASSPDAICTAPPTPREIGDTVYPTFPEYKHLRSLGPIFTAARCGPSRLEEVIGGEDADYKFGSTIGLKTEPSPQLRSTLESIGYQCKPDDCKSWELWKTVKVRELLKLMPYTSEMIGGGCLNCG